MTAQTTASSFSCALPPATPNLNGADAQELHDFFHQVVCEFDGNANDLEAALGMFVLCRYLGWRAMYLIHSKKTIKKYEGILGITVQAAFDENGPHAHRSAGWQVAASRSNFWKVVSGEDPIDRDERKKLYKGT